jgi:HK97 family phage major capsid protein
MIQGQFRKPGERRGERSLYRACQLIGQRVHSPGLTKPWPEDQMVDQVIRAAQSPTSIADAPDLVTVLAEFIEALQPYSASAALFGICANLTFGRAGLLAVPGVSEIPPATWIAEGAPFPVAMGLSAMVTLAPYKIGTIVALTNEMLRSASAEAVIRSALASNIGPSLDRYLFDALPGVPGLRPPGLLFGVTGKRPPPAAVQKP